MFLTLEESNVKVRCIELVRNAEPYSSKFTSFNDTAVQLTKNLNQSTEIACFPDVQDLFQAILIYDSGVNFVQTIFHAFGRLISNFDAHLQDSQWELVGGVTRHLKSKVLIDYVLTVWLLEFLFHSSNLTEREVAVVENDPTADFFAHIDSSSCFYLLSFTH